jgi:hypothetical protein
MELTEECRELHNEWLNNYYSLLKVSGGDKIGDEIGGTCGMHER